MEPHASRVSWVKAASSGCLGAYLHPKVLLTPMQSRCHPLDLLQATSPTCPLSAGTCLGPTIQIGEETVITVDAKAAGKGKVTCKVSTPDGAELDVDVVENHDGTFDIYYTAPEPGKYVITIRFGGEQIPNSPFHVVVSMGCLGQA